MRLEKEIKDVQTKSNKYAHRHKCTHRSTHEFLHIAVGCPFWHTVSFFLSFRAIHTPQCMYVQLCVSIVFKGLVHVSVCNCVFLLLCELVSSTVWQLHSQMRCLTPLLCLCTSMKTCESLPHPENPTDTLTLLLLGRF